MPKFEIEQRIKTLEYILGQIDGANQEYICVWIVSHNERAIGIEGNDKFRSGKPLSPSGVRYIEERVEELVEEIKELKKQL